MVSPWSVPFFCFFSLFDYVSCGEKKRWESYPPDPLVQVFAGLLVKWEERYSLGNNPIEALLKTKKKKIHPSPLGHMKPLEEALLKYIFKKREQGIEISTLAIVVVASNLSTEFGEKNFVPRCSAVKRFVKAHSLVYRMGMHLCQRKPKEVEAEASN